MLPEKGREQKMLDKGLNQLIFLKYKDVLDGKWIWIRKGRGHLYFFIVLIVLVVSNLSVFWRNA